MRQLITLFLLAIGFSLAAQNLVKNPGFETVDGKIKEGGAISDAPGWKSPTGLKADLFSADAKADEFGTPNNKYGREQPMGGENYAGIVAYSDKGKSPRSYITGELKEELTAGRQYCVEVNFSLSDLSKLAVNSIGAVLHDKEYKMEGVEESILVSTDVQHSRNKIVNTQLYWETVCGVFTASGGEKFITIGSFTPDREIQKKKLKKPDGFTTVQQVNVAYYFVDNVSVKLLENPAQCACEDGLFEDKPVVVQSTSMSNVSEDDEAKEISSTYVLFEENMVAINEEGERALEKIIKHFELDSDLKLKIIGHCSSNEYANAKKRASLATVSLKRAQAVVRYLVQKGVKRSRITAVEGVNATKPVGDSKSPDFQRINQSVSFEVTGGK